MNLDEKETNAIAKLNPKICQVILLEGVMIIIMRKEIEKIR
jgi:hypothetical protein